MKKIALLFIIVFHSLIAFGYNTRNHRLITQRAIDLLNKYFQKDFITAAEAEAIVNGNISEDKFSIKWLTRLTNYHFYNPLKSKELWRRSKSINVRFERIAGRWIRRIGSDRYYYSEKYFYSVGEISHHIQDYTNPAHVVPVNHGGPFMDKDRFDEQDCSIFLPWSIMIDTNVVYAKPFLGSILKPVAIETLASIHTQFEIKRKDDQSSKTIDWTYFWQDDPKAWFGGYGLLGNNYLQPEIRQGDTVYLIDKTVYENYSLQQVRLAVLRTANFIYFAKKKLQEDRG